MHLTSYHVRCTLVYSGLLHFNQDSAMTVPWQCKMTGSSMEVRLQTLMHNKASVNRDVRKLGFHSSGTFPASPSPTLAASPVHIFFSFKS